MSELQSVEPLEKKPNQYRLQDFEGEGRLSGTAGPGINSRFLADRSTNSSEQIDAFGPSSGEVSSLSAGPPQDPVTPNRPCTHCGLSTPVSLNTPNNQPVFCCQGCHGAYELIHGLGLTDFYALRDSMTVTGTPRSAREQNNYAQFDSEDFLGESTPQLTTDGNLTCEMGIQGLHCAACSWLIERAMSEQSGVLVCRVKMSDHTVRLLFDPKAISLSSIARLLDRLGYRLLPLDRSREKHLQVENRRILMQIAVSAFLAANAMWIAIALYAGHFSGVAASHKYFFGWVGIVLGTASVLGPGRTFFVGALAAIRTRTPHMDMPIALGLTAGTVAGLGNAITGSGPIYFDCLSLLVFLLLIGRWIQFRQQHTAAKAVDLMLRITPRHAELLGPDDQTNIVLVDRLKPGDRIRVGAGQQIAVDGQIVSGHSQLNRSLLTGESRPIAVRPGDKVEAGTINIVSQILVEVSAVGNASRIGQVMQTVELAASQRIPIVQLADRVGGGFVVAVMILAVITFVRWLPTGLFDATNYATALLIVACPCALALATPLAIAVGIGRAARSQILIRDGLSLQHLSQPGMLWFDKTGTLTEGRQAARLVWGSSNSLQYAAKVEAQCQHPIAQAIITAAQYDSANSIISEASEVKTSDGGISGIVCGIQIHVGNSRFMEGQGIDIPQQLERLSEQVLNQGASPVFIAMDLQLAGLLGLSDPVRPMAEKVVRQAKRLGWKVGILSGDHPQIAFRVGQAVGIESTHCLGGISPEQKLDTVQESGRQFPTVVMVGDGANDAAALAAADVGIAVRGGAEVSLHAAPVFLASNRLPDLIRLLQGSTTTRRVILLNFLVSFTYNSTTVYSAWVGWISPLMAAILMPLSSATVLGLTFLIPSFTDPNIEWNSEPSESSGGKVP